MNISPGEITKQFNRVSAAGWLPAIGATAKRAGTTEAHFLALGSRESNLKNIRGDYRGGVYHGFGGWQVDRGTDAAFVETWSASNYEPGLRRGGEIYAAKYSQIIRGQKKKLSVRGRNFVGRAVEPDDARRIATAAYNCGLWAYYHFSKGEHIDSTTTGRDYSRDVYDRAIYFAALLDGYKIIERDDKLVLRRDPELGKPANTTLFHLPAEIDAQGKYCRPEHAALIGKQKLALAPDDKPKKVEPQVSDAELERVEHETQIAQGEPGVNAGGETPDPTPVDVVVERDDQAPQQVAGGDTATETVKTEQAQTGETTVSTTTQVAKNEQDISTPAIVNEPEPYNKIGFWATIKGDLAKIGITNGLLQGAGEYVEKAQTLPEWAAHLVVKLVFIVGVISALYFLARLIHFGFDYLKKKNRLETQAKINADPTKKDLIFAPHDATAQEIALALDAIKQARLAKQAPASSPGSTLGL